MNWSRQRGEETPETCRRGREGMMEEGRGGEKKEGGGVRDRKTEADREERKQTSESTHRD